MAVLNFNGYEVEKMCFHINPEFNEKSEEGFENKIDFDMNIDEKNNKAKITIGLLIGEELNEHHPFFLDVKISGFFEYDISKDESKIGFQDLLLNNGAAILYPYLRSTVSSLTNLSGMHPYNMPTINIARTLQRQDDVE